MNDVILCYEMIPFALLLNHAFPYHEFFTPDEGKPVAESVRQMMNVGDVLQDAYHSFTPSYQDYVVARDDVDHHASSTPGSTSSLPTRQDGNTPQKVIRTRTYLIGNLDRKNTMEKNSESEGPTPDSQNKWHTPPNDSLPAVGESSLESGQGVHSDNKLPPTLTDESYGFDGEWLNDVVEVAQQSNAKKKTYDL